MNYQQDCCIGLGEKTSTRKNPSYSTLETYDKMPIFIPVNITEDAVKLVVQNFSVDSVPGGTD